MVGPVSGQRRLRRHHLLRVLMEHFGQYISQLWYEGGPIYLYASLLGSWSLTEYQPTTLHGLTASIDHNISKKTSDIYFWPWQHEP